MRKGGYVYIISNKRRTVLYIGMTSDIRERMFQHKNGIFNGFSKKYNCTDLMFFEFYPDIEDAVVMEWRMKKWKRAWKEELISKINPELWDLSIDWFDNNGNLIKE